MSNQIISAKESYTIVKNIGYKSYYELYLDWVNNFLTIEGFAGYHNIETYKAEILIENARCLYAQSVPSQR